MVVCSEGASRGGGVTRRERETTQDAGDRTRDPGTRDTGQQQHQAAEEQMGTTGHKAQSCIAAAAEHSRDGRKAAEHGSEFLARPCSQRTRAVSHGWWDHFHASLFVLHGSTNEIYRGGRHDAFGIFGAILP